tara:strand:- start:708 stop:1706 length:999 start_codon:yes stop_codon:yes gene_type:complete
MRQGIYTSGFFHLFGGFLLLANFQLLENNSNEVLNKVSVKLLSEQELIELAEREKTRAKEVENFQPRTITDLNTNPKKIAIPPKINAGNEIKGLTEPNIIKIKKRKTSDEIITEHAQRGDDDVEKQVEKKSNRTVQKNDLQEKSNNDRAKQKNTSSQISSEGENVEIVSGALKIAKLPLLKPNFVEQSDQNDLKKTISTKQNNEVYNNLIEQVLNSQKKEKVAENSIQRLTKARILQTLNDNWNVVSINRLPNYEKYVIILELKIDENGYISGPIKLVYPQKASGNFEIAKRSAINAVLESSPFPVAKESFPRGLVLRVVFDPKTNVGVNNG